MKKSRNLRRSKIAATEADGKEVEVAATTQNIEESVAPEQIKMAQMQRLKQRKAEKKLSALSFDEDVPDQPPPRIKPLRIPVPPALHEGTAPSHTQISAAGEYTAERIAELQQASKQLPKYAQVEVETNNAEGFPLQEEGNDDDLFDINEQSVLMAKALRQRQKEKTHEPMLSLDGDANSGMLDYQPPHATNSSWDQEGDEEERIWAEDQIRKGMTTSALRFPQTEFGRLDRKNKTLESTPRPVSASSLKEHHLSVMQASEHAVSSLRQVVARLRHSESQATKNLSKTREKLVNSKATVDQIQTQLTFAGDKYIFLQKLRAYISNLCAMLFEKTPIIETLEEESESIKKERARMHYYKSVDSFYEDMDPIEAGVTAVSTVLNDHANAASATETEAAFIRALEERQTQIASGKHIPVILDEFGRDENSNRRFQSARRRKRRAAQKEVMAAKFFSNFENSKDIAIKSAYVEPELGGETTSESEAEEDSFLQRNSEILGAAGLVFRDVAEEYASLEAVCSNIETNFKTNYPAEYERAYMMLSMPVLISPFVRLELLEWSPLHSHQSTVHTISDQNWYRVLSTYGINSGKTMKNGDSDSCDENSCEGRDVISKLVQALVLPQATFLIRHCWNPYSVADSLAIASVLTEISKHVSQDSEDWRNIVTEVKSQLERSVSRLKVPAWSEMTLEACGRNKYQALYQSARCFGRALRVLKSLCAFQDVLPHSIVHELAIDKIVIELLVPYTMSSPHHGVQSQRIERIVAALPQKWVIGEGGVQNCGLKVALCSLQEAAKLLLQEPGKPEHVNKASHVASALEKLGDRSLALQLHLGFGG